MLNLFVLDKEQMDDYNKQTFGKMNSIGSHIEARSRTNNASELKDVYQLTRIFFFIRRKGFHPTTLLEDNYCLQF